MADAGGTIGGSGLPRGGSPLIYLPIAWVALVALHGAYSIPAMWSTAFDYRLPDSVLPFIYAGLAVAVVNILWGLYLFGLAYSRSARFPRHFTIWQVANILWLLAGEAYVLVAPDFVFSPWHFAVTLVMIAIGIFCIHILQRNARGEFVYSNAETGRPPLLVSFIAAVLGIVLGAIAGAGIGVVVGQVIAEATQVSCFEGACGYFVAAIGLLGALVGAVAGGIFAVWRVNRRRAA